MATYQGKYSGIAEGLTGGFKVGHGIGEAKRTREEKTQQKEMRAAAIEGGYSSDAMKEFAIEDPEGAEKTMGILDSMSENDQKLAQVELDTAGSLAGFGAGANDPEEFASRHQMVAEEIKNGVESGSISPELAAQFPAPGDPNARQKYMLLAAKLAKTGDVMDLYFSTQKEKMKTGETNTRDDYKTQNQLRKQKEKSKLDRSLESLKQGNKIGLENLKHGNTTDRLKLQGKDKDDPKPEDVNKLVRQVSKNYEKKVTGTDEWGEEVTETRSPAEIRKFQRAMKKNIDSGMSEFDAEAKAAEEAFGEGGGSSAVGASPAFRYNAESGKLEAVQ